MLSTNQYRKFICINFISIQSVTEPSIRLQRIIKQ